MKAIVVGAGPAGLSAAIGLLRSGFDVTVLDQNRQVKSRVCGAFLNPEAVRHLDWLGIREPAEREGILVRQCRLTASFLPAAQIPIRQNGREGLGLPRARLEELLSEKIIAEGGRIEKGVNIRSTDELKLRGADLFVMATGRGKSPTLTLPPKGGGKPSEARQGGGWYGWNALFSNAGQNPGDLSLHFYQGGYVGTLTYKDGMTNVCGLIYRDRTEPVVSWEKIFEGAMERQPHLKNLLRDSQRESEWRGVGPLPHTTHLRKNGDFVVVGDAAAVGDPFMGEGIGRSLGSGPMLFAAVKESSGLGAFDAPKTKMIYERLWMKYYTSRLRLGLLTREVIRRRWLFRPAVSFLLKSPAPLLYTRFSHTGFKS